MTIKIRDSPATRCVASKVIPFPKPVCGILIALLLLLMLFISAANNREVTESQTSLPTVITQPSTHLGLSAAELIPVITGGAGGSASLGGNSSLGGDSH